MRSDHLGFGFEVGVYVIGWRKSAPLGLGTPRGDIDGSVVPISEAQ